MSANAYIVFKLNIKTDTFTTVETNIKEEQLTEFVVNCISTQFGAGCDQREPEVKDEYTIKIALAISNDTFYVEDDTGNHSLTIGILAQYLTHLRQELGVPA